jgi:hypothetical protein
MECVQKNVPCPDCEGKRYNTIILDGETFTIDCRGCERGWMGSTGYLETYEYTPSVFEGKISGVEKSWNEDSFEYHVSESPSSSKILKEENTFATREEAEDRAVVLARDQSDEEAKKITKKTKPNSSWAWHVRYYQKQIRDAEETIERASLQLDAAKKHVKVEKEVK